MPTGPPVANKKAIKETFVLIIGAVQYLEMIKVSQAFTVNMI